MNKEIMTFRSTGMVDIEPAIIATDQKTGIKYFGVRDSGFNIKWECALFPDREENKYEQLTLDRLRENKGVNREATYMIREIYGVDKNFVRGATKNLMFIDDVGFTSERHNTFYDDRDAKGEAFFNDL